VASVARKPGRLVEFLAVVALVLLFAASAARAALFIADDTTAPKISGLRVNVDQGRSYYRLSEPAAVEFLLEVRRPGRVVGQNCLPVSPSNRKDRPCSLWLPRETTFRGPGGPGRHSARIPAGQSLSPGAYRLTMTATDPSGNVAAATRRFAQKCVRRLYAYRGTSDERTWRGSDQPRVGAPSSRPWATAARSLPMVSQA